MPVALREWTYALTPYRGGTGKGDSNKTQPKTPDSLCPGASQAAGATPTLRYGPTGDSAPRLRLKAAGMAERFPFGPASTARKCPGLMCNAI